MVTTPPSQKEWLVILPDHEGVLEKRMSVRAQHFTNLTPAVQAGKWLLGGATLEKHPEAGESLKITGSIMLASAPSEAEVREMLRRDIYSTSGVWNWDKVQVIPFLSGVRRGMVGGL